MYKQEAGGVWGYGAEADDAWMTQERAEAEAARRAADIARASSWYTWNRDPKKLEELLEARRVAGQDRQPAELRKSQSGDFSVGVGAVGGRAGGEKAGCAAESSKQIARVQTSKALLELGITAEREEAINRCGLQKLVPVGLIFFAV